MERKDLLDAVRTGLSYLFTNGSDHSGYGVLRKPLMEVQEEVCHVLRTLQSKVAKIPIDQLFATLNAVEGLAKDWPRIYLTGCCLSRWAPEDAKDAADKALAALKDA